MSSEGLISQGIIITFGAELSALASSVADVVSMLSGVSGAAGEVTAAFSAMSADAVAGIGGVDASLATVAESSAALGGYLDTLGAQVFSTGAGFDGLSMSAADATGVLAASTDATTILAASTDTATVGVSALAGAVDLGAMSFEEYIAYIAESNVALGIVTEATGMAADMARGLSVSLDGVAVSSSAAATSLAGTNVALADTSVSSAKAVTSLGGVAASEEGVGVASGGLSKMKLGLAALVVGTVAFAGVSMKMGADFQQSMLKIQAYAGLTKTQMDSMSQSVLSMSSAVGVGPKELADALYPIVSSGYGAADALNILKLSAETAAASGAKTAVVADALTTSLGAMHAPASQAGLYMDMLNKIVSIGKGEVPQYAAVIGKLSLSAAGAGVDFSTMGAALADLTTHGIPSVAQASTYLGNMFTQIGVKTDALAQHAKKAGLAFDAHKFATLSLADKLDYLQKISGGTQSKLLALMGGSTTALKAFQALEGGTKDLKSNLDAMKNSAGATEAAFQTASSGLNASMGRLKATFQVVMIEIGQKLLPIATGGVDLLNKAIQSIGPMFTYVGNVLKSLNLSDFSVAWIDVKSAVVGLGQAFQVLGARLNPIVGDFDPLAEAIQKVAKSGLSILTDLLWKAYVGISALSTAIISGKGPLADIGNLFSQLGPPIKTLASAIGGELGHEFKTLGQDAQQFGSWFSSSVLPAIKDALPGFINLASTLIGTVAPAFVQIRSAMFDVIQHAFEVFGPIIAKVVPPLIRFAGILANDVANGLKFIMPYVVDAAKAIGKFADDIMDRVVPIVKQWITELTPMVNNFMDNWKTAWPIISGILKASWEAMAGIVKIAWALISGYFKIGLDLISGNWGQAWTDLKDTFSGVWDGIKTYLKGAIDALVTFLHPLLEAMSHLPGPAGDMARGVLNAFDGMKDGAAQKTAEMKTKVLGNTVKMHTEAASELDQMRQELIEKIKNTSDPVQKQALEMKLKTVTHMEEMHIEAASKAENMKKKVVAHVKDMKEQSQGGIAGVGKYFGDRFTEAKNAVTGAFGTVGHWFQDRWKDIQSIWGGVGKWFQDVWKDIAKAWETGVNKVTGFFQYLYDHSTLFQKIVDAIRNAFSTVVDDIQKAWKFVSDWLVGKWSDLSKSSKDTWKKFSDAIHDAWSTVVSHVTDAWNTISGIVSGAWNKYIAGPLGKLWNWLSTNVSNAWNDHIAKPVSGLWTSFANSVGDAWTKLSKKLGDLWTNAKNTVNGWVNDAYTWGINLITSLASGITAAVGGALHTALNGAATAIKNVVGWHSPTKEGPGADSDKWAPALVNMLSEGLIAGVPKLQSAAAQLAKPLALSFNPSASNQFKYPSSTSSQSIIINIPKSDMYIDGQKVANALAPHQANTIRLKGDVRRH